MFDSRHLTLLLVGSFLPFYSQTAGAQGPCDGGAATLHSLTKSIRTGNNEITLSVDSWMSGYWAVYYLPRAQGRVRFNTLWISDPITTAPSNWYDHAFHEWQYDLQATGAGDYYMHGVYWANSPYCEYFGYPPLGTIEATAYDQVRRPDAPEQLPGSAPLFYLGPGVYSSGSYSAQLPMRPGDAKGAAGNPSWVISAGSSFGYLTCANNCGNSTFVATKRGSYCGMYDVQIRTSYDGFLSEPFPIFINAPNNTVSYGSWTEPYYDGYVTRIEYSISGLCALDPPMASYDLNENFEEFGELYAGNNWMWPQPNGYFVAGERWWDNIGLGSAGCSSAPCTPPLLSQPEAAVDWVSQSIRLGSYQPGSGARVQWDRIVRYTTRAAHEYICTPCP